MLSRSKLSRKQAHVDRVFGTGITSQIPISIHSMSLHSRQPYEKYILFFLTAHIRFFSLFIKFDLHLYYHHWS